MPNAEEYGIWNAAARGQKTPSRLWDIIPVTLSLAMWTGAIWGIVG